MTLAQAIGMARAGDTEGFAFVFYHTMPTVWLAATVLGCPRVGTAVVEIYRSALHSISSLRSPSDLRVWLGQNTYDSLRQQAAELGLPIAGLTDELAAAYEEIAALSVSERTALLLMCADGCSAAQAAQVLDCPEIEVKRAVRRARQTVAQRMQQRGCTDVCNTAWLTACFDRLRQRAAPQLEQQEQLLECVLTGEPYEEEEPVWLSMKEDPVTVPAVQSEAEQEEKEKGGFLSKLFRSRRFG